MKDRYISVDQARYAISILAKYLYIATVKTSTNFYKTNFPSDMNFTEADASTSYEYVEKLNRQFNIHHKACIVSLIYLLSTRVDLSF